MMNIKPSVEHIKKSTPYNDVHFDENVANYQESTCFERYDRDCDYLLCIDANCNSHFQDPLTDVFKHQIDVDGMGQGQIPASSVRHKVNLTADHPHTVNASGTLCNMYSNIQRKTQLQKVERASYTSCCTFNSYDPLKTSGDPPEVLQTVKMLRERQAGLNTNDINTSSSVYDYKNISLEQEKYRLVDFTWRNVNERKSFVAVINEDRHSVRATTPYLQASSPVKLPASNIRRRRQRVQTPVQRTAANMRERRRMCHLNVAFDRLKEHLPNVKGKKKMSRIQTLKAAIYYIHLLKDSLRSC